MGTAASYLARQADTIFFGTLAFSVFLLVLITATMLYFVVRYRRDRNPEPADIRGNLCLEITWTVLPTVLVLGIFWAGLIGFEGMRTVPPDAMEIDVAGRMWSWSFTYPDGRTTGELRLPKGRAARLNLHSADVLHSFFVPAFRIKEDAVPGMETYVWLQPERVGNFDIFCAEYCGAGHSRMLGKVVVMEDAAFDAWYGAGEKKDAANGEELLATKGCTGCHALDGSRRVGPGFQGIFGRTVIVLTEGREREIVVDRDYLLRSILAPKADVVKGYPSIMPAFDTLSHEERKAIVDYLESMKAPGSASPGEADQ